MSERPTILVHLLPALVPPGSLHGGVAVVIDVLRASTVIVQALASGCEAVIPCLEVDEARRVAASLPRGTAILGGERHGVPIEGFDLGNSPGDYTEEVCRGRTLVITTTNGTKAILACLEAARVLVASFANVETTWGALHEEETTRPIHIVCAGTEGEVSLEDTLLAGELVRRITGFHCGIRDWSEFAKNVTCNDQALIVAGLAWGVSHQIGEAEAKTLRPRILATGKGGRRVAELGFADDIDAAAGRKEIKLVAEVAREPIRILRKPQLTLKSS